MAKTNFYLDKRTNPCPITLYVSIEGRRIKIPTGEFTLPGKWDAEKQKPKSDIEKTGRLRKLEEDVLLIIQNIKSDGGTVTAAAIKAALDGKSRHMGLVGFIGSYIEERRPTTKPGTLVNYTYIYKVLTKYEKGLKRSIQFKDVDLDFFLDFKSYLFKIPLSINSAATLVAILKIVMNEAFERGLHTNFAYKSKKFTIKQVKTETTYLSVDEIMKIFVLPLENLNLQITRDLFVVACFTALRFSDFSSIKPEEIKEREGRYYLEKSTKKRGKDVVIPLHPAVVQILERWDFCLPSGFTITAVNDHVKELARLAGIDEIITVSKSVGGMEVKVQKPKWQTITSHTARRSAATNMLKAGIEEWRVAAIGGWENEKMLRKIYNKLSGEDTAKLVSEHEFFKTKVRKIN